MCGPRLSASTCLPYTAGPGMPGPYRLDKLKSCPRGKVLLRAVLLAYRRNFCYNTKAACFTTDGKALHTTAGGWPHFRKEVRAMPKPLTFHVLGFPIAVTVKSKGNTA